MTRPSSKATNTLVYPLVDGYVHHWLALGPVDQPIEQLANQPVGQAQDAAPPDFAHAVELERVNVVGAEHLWDLYRAAPDHWLAWHGFLPTPAYRRAWGFAHLHSAQPQTIILHCTLACSAHLWLNGQPLLSIESGAQQTEKRSEIPCFEQNDRAGCTDPATYRVEARLAAGVNPLLLRLEHRGVRDLSLLAALRVEAGTPNAPVITVHLPTPTAAPRRRQRLEEVYSHTRLDRAVYGRHDPVRLLAPARAHKIPMQLRLQKTVGAIYAETIDKLQSGKAIESVRGSQLPPGPLDAVVMAPFQQYYNEGLRARHTFPIFVANQPFHTQVDEQSAAAQNRDARLIEALRAQVQRGDSVYSELAKMAFGAWDQLSRAAMDAALERVMAGAAGALPDLLALTTLRARMPAYQGFPHALLPALDQGLMHFAARKEDALVAWDAPDDATQLALLAARLLVGQLYPAQVATVETSTLVAWLGERGRRGLAQWHSDHELLVMALAPLISLAQEDGVRESAAALLDALALAWATHTFRGTFGASRARVTPAGVRSGRFAPEAALMRLLWGTGGYQNGIEAAVALGLAGTSYVLPDVIRAIALAQPETAWMQERHQDANLATYRTPDYLLSSVQDFCAGTRGGQEQIWQATLGPEALVFTTHPASFSQHENAAPGWWVGNGTRPRVAQHRDALLARYHLPADAWLPFTHAHFPTYVFDEHAIIEGWAFGRVGDGYLALWSDPPFTPAEDGPDAGRELRAQGRAALWLCQMGLRAVDSDFADFQRNVLATAPQVHDEAATWTTIRGDTLTLGNSGPLLVNGQAAPLDNFPRHSSPFGHANYPGDQLDILYGEDGLRLRF